MPLAVRSVVGLLGLSTEGSPIDPAATPPNTMYDCLNVTFNRVGQAVARKGNPLWVDLTSVTTVATLAQKLEGLFPTTPNEEGYQVVYMTNSNGGQSVYVSAAGTASGSRVQQYTGAPTAGIRAPATPTSASYPYDTMELNSYNPRGVFSFDRLFVTAGNGLFRGEVDTTVKNGYLKRLTTSVPNITISTQATPSQDNAWLATGYKCRICAVLVEYTEEGQPIESPVSSETVLENISFPTNPTLMFSVNTHNIRDLSRTYIEVYRTKSYKFGGVQETEFRKCFAIALSDSAVTNTGDTSSVATPIDLVANDLAVSSQESIYTSINGDGGPTLANTTIPVANDITVYKGYTVYAGVKIPPYIQVQMTAIPAATDHLYIGSNGTDTPMDITLTTQANAAASAVPTTGKMDAASFTYQGARGAACDLVIRPVDPTSTSGFTDKCVVPFKAKTSTRLTKDAGVNGTTTIHVRPSGPFPLEQFVSPQGAFAVVVGTAGSTAGRVVDIISYDDFEQIPSSGKVDFYGCFSVAGLGTTACWTTDATYYLYPLKSANINNLDIYAISTDASTLAAGFSLLPSWYQYPIYEYIQDPVGIVSGLSSNGTSIQCNPVMYGLLFKAKDTRLDRSVLQAVKDINNTRTALQPYAVYTGEPYKFTLVGAFAGKHSLANTGTNAGKYDAVFLSTSAAPTVRFDEGITTTPDNFAETVDLPNALVFSKLNRPECVAIGQVLTPLKVGQDFYRIQRVAVNNDQMYVFKENEGVYRVAIQEGGVVPDVAQVSVFDNTMWLTGDNTLQEISESIFFLSNKGVLVLNNSNITNISRQIESKIKDAVVRQGSNLSDIRSFKNDFRRQYGLYFPVVNQTFVYDVFTQQWTIWDAPFDSAYATIDGRLTLARTVASYAPGAPTPTYGGILTRDLQTSGWENPANQVDMEIPVTSTSVGNTAVFTNTTSGFLGSFQNIAVLRSTYKLYYVTTGGDIYPITQVSIGTSGEMTATFDDGISKPDSNGATPVAGKIVLGVYASTTFNRFWAYSSVGQTYQGDMIPSSPAGAMTISQYTECHPQVVGICTRMTVGFEADATTLTFNPTNSVTLPAFYDIIRVSVPRNQARGRWIMVKIEHTQPYENYTLGGIGWVFKDLASFKVKIRGN